MGAATFITNMRHRQRLTECIQSLSNPSGRSLSSNEILRLAMWLQLHHEYTEAAAIDASSVWCGSSRITIAPAYHHYLETNELIEVDSSNRGRGNPNHPQHDTSLTLEHILGIHQLISEAKMKNEFMPAKVIMHQQLMK